MPISRRNFLRFGGMAGTTAIVAPTYFFAPRGGWPGKTHSFKDVNGLYLPSAEQELELFQWQVQDAVQDALYNTLNNIPKIPYTQAGLNLLTQAVDKTMSKFLLPEFEYGIDLRKGCIS